MNYLQGAAINTFDLNVPYSVCGGCTEYFCRIWWILLQVTLLSCLHIFWIT